MGHLFQQDDQVTDNPPEPHDTTWSIIKGEPKGFTREYAIDGTLVWEGELRSVLPDTIHGVSRGFFRDGTVSYEYTFADGLMQGPAKQFYENGELKWSCNYTDDFPDGTYKVLRQRKSHAGRSGGEGEKERLLPILFH